MNGDCALCDTQNVELKHSHIIPEFLYTKVYTNTHKFKPISSDSSVDRKFEQKGYREYLLCNNCEQKLSVWENTLSKTMKELITQSYNSISVTTSGSNEIVSRLNYDHIKLAILSIFWRMSISSLDLFSSYNLGPYTNKVKELINSMASVNESIFPVLISKGMISNNFQEGMLITLNKGRYDNCTTIQSVVLNGFVIDIHMTENKKIPREISLFMLKTNGTFIMTNKNFDDLGISLDELQKNTWSTKNQEFYAKYHKT